MPLLVIQRKAIMSGRALLPYGRELHRCVLFEGPTVTKIGFPARNAPGNGIGQQPRGEPERKEAIMRETSQPLSHAGAVS